MGISTLLCEHICGKVIIPSSSNTQAMRGGSVAQRLHILMICMFFICLFPFIAPSTLNKEGLFRTGLVSTVKLSPPAKFFQLKNTSQYQTIITSSTTKQQYRLINNGGKVSNIVKGRLVQILVTVACTFLCGSNYIVSTALQQDAISEELLSALRLAVGSIALMKSVLSFRGNCDMIISGFELGMWLSIGIISQTVSLKHFEVGIVATFLRLLGSMLPHLFDFIKFRCHEFFGTAGDPVVTKRYVSTMSKTVISVVIMSLLASLGAVVALLVGRDKITPIDSVLLLSSFSFSMYYWRTQSVAQRFPQHEYFLTGVVLLISSIFCCFWAIWQSELPLTTVEWAAVWSRLTGKSCLPLLMLLYSAFVCSTLTTFCDQKMMQHLSSAETAIIYTLEPLFLIFLGSTFRGYKYIKFNK